MSSDWLARTRSELSQLKLGDGWGYGVQGEPAVEPSCLIGLGLLAQPASETDLAELQAMGRWLERLQQDQGSLGISASAPAPHWPTAHALLFWSALGNFDDARRRAAHFLLNQPCHTLPRQPGDVIEHDTSIVGWPWVSSTHSWVEPTSLAVLALARHGAADQPRVREGLRLLRDRAIPGGGWNYGNKVVFGATLRPQPAPTGLALLALASASPRGDVVNQATTYLKHSLETMRSPQSLCWGLLGLSAWGERPSRSDAWLAQVENSIRRRGTPSLLRAYLLLAAGPKSLEVVGVKARRS